MDMKESLDSLLGLCMDLGQILRADVRERGDARYRVKSLIRRVGEDKGVERKTIYR